MVELNEADKIARRILTKQSASDDEFRYAVMFNLTAMTQLLWELSSAQGGPSKNEAPSTAGTSYSQSGLGHGHLRSRVIKLVPFAALVAFLVGIGLGYMIP